MPLVMHEDASKSWMHPENTIGALWNDFVNNLKSFYMQDAYGIRKENLTYLLHMLWHSLYSHMCVYVLTYAEIPIYMHEIYRGRDLLIFSEQLRYVFSVYYNKFCIYAALVYE